MADEPHPTTPTTASSPVERVIERSYADDGGVGKPLSQRTRQTPRSVEAYLKAGNLPRYMQRLRDIHKEVERHRKALQRAHLALQERCAEEPERFAQRWREHVARHSFDAVNQLIREHNEWYPIEARLPLDPRTRDYVLINGRSYRRTELTPEWVLAQLPPVPAAQGGRSGPARP